MHVRIKDMHIINVYVPNGESLSSEKFAYKRFFMWALTAYVERYASEPLIVMGDFNIAPHVRDVYAPDHFSKRLLFSPEERVWLRTLMSVGLFDIQHVLLREAKDIQRYTWWDYRNMAYFPEKGLRIDLMLATAKGFDAIDACGVWGQYRQDEKPSDHVPLWCTLKE